MITLAYDGSLHGAWVARYAARLARAEPDLKLDLLHVADHTGAAWSDRLAELANDCRRVGVGLQARVVPADASVAAVLSRESPIGPEHFLVCGTRTSRPESGGLLGPIATQLFSAAPRQVAAFHVGHPGLLGMASDLLLPLSGHPRGLAALRPWLRRLMPGLERIHLLSVAPPRTIAGWWWRPWRRSPSEAAQQRGRAGVERAMNELLDDEALKHLALDIRVVVADDPGREIVQFAGHARSHLIVLGASDARPGPLPWVRDPIETVLAAAPCDVMVYRGLA